MSDKREKPLKVKSNVLLDIYNIRHFILHLVRWDIKYKFRRSKLGMLWTILQPLFMALIIAFIFGTVFNIPMKDYAPYILAGFIVWDLVLSGVVGNSFAFIRAESYIKQCNHPMVIYPLRETLVSMAVFLIALIALLLWIAIINPYNLIVVAISIPLTLCVLFCFIFPLSIISSQIHVRYRDYPLILGLVMQVLWYTSPVFFKEEMFKGNEALYNWFLYNPVTSILNLIREPFLYGRLPELFAYSYILVISLIIGLFAYIVSKKYDKSVIHYI